MDLKSIFEPKSVAVIGASHDPKKIGHVIFKNFLEGGFKGEVYPINPSADKILNRKCYASVLEVKDTIDCAIIAVPAPFVAKVLTECGEKGIKGAVVITSGFAEVGNVKGEKELVEIAKKYGIAMIGPNCLGVIDTKAKVDSVFLPMYKLQRPKKGDIAFITQSGAVGSCVIDLAAEMGVGISKFVSYGNAAVVNECDLLEYLGNDPNTRVISSYFEMVKDGKRFLDVARNVTARKPVITIKAGKTASGMKAAASHTAAMAGSAEVYSAVFRQTRIIEVESLTDLFDFSKIFLQPPAMGKRVGVITNGGGVGVLTSDWIEKYGLQLTSFSDETKKKAREKFPPHVNISNPLDIAGDADKERYAYALDLLMNDDKVDSIIVILLFQTVSLDASVSEAVIAASEQRKKPIIAISIGGEYTEKNKIVLESNGVPTYSSPYVAAGALAKLTWYYRCTKDGVCTLLI